MERKHHKPEEIVANLQQVGVMVGQNQLVADGKQVSGVVETRHCRWRSEHGGLNLDKVRRHKQEYSRQRLAIFDLLLGKLTFKKPTSGDF